MDRKNVTKGIDICLQRFRCGEDCPYYKDAKSGCMEQLRDDALKLIDTQYKLILELQNLISIGTKMMNGGEAVKPKNKVRHEANAQIQHFCGNCNTMLHGKPKFCSECGKRVLW